MKRPGRRAGVRRYQRYDQQALPLGTRTLDQEFSLTSVADDPEHLDVLAFLATCQSCGRYIDVRQHERCPNPCGGYLG